MRRTLPNVPEIVAGLAIVSLGAFAAFEATSYEIGTIAHMGPGFFPLALGICLIALGSFLVVTFMFEEPTEFEFPVAPFLFIASSVLAFAMLLEQAGLVTATVALVILASLANRKSRFVTVAASAIVLSIFGVVVFIWMLRLPLAPLRW